MAKKENFPTKTADEEVKKVSQEEHERFMAGLFVRLSQKEVKGLNHHLLLLSQGISEYINE